MSFESEIQNIPGLLYTPQKDLTNFTTFRLSSVGDYMEVQSIEALQELVILLSKYKKKFLVLGWGANQILPAVCDGLILHLSFPFDPTYFDTIRDEYELPASVGLNQLTGHAVKFGIMGWEVFTGIPASLGGAIFMNAGTNLGEIGSLVKSFG